MRTRSKVVPVNDGKYEVRRLPADVGSFIFMRMLGIQMRMQAEQQANTATAQQQEQAEAAETVKHQIDGETRVRALAFSVFSGGMEFKDFQFIQKACLKCVSKQEVRDEHTFFMPLMQDDGTWVPSYEDLQYDTSLVMNLTTEVMVLCFSDFFEKSGTGT